MAKSTRGLPNLERKEVILLTQLEQQRFVADHDANVAADFTQAANDVEAFGGEPAVVEELRDAAVEYAERAADLTIDTDAAYGVT